jgi:hypothetical protein
MSSSVLQPWVEKIPWKQQSILFSSLRGPDQDYLKAIKLVSRWMRAVSQQNADPTKPYMAVTALPAPSDLDKELEHCTVHFVHHFADGLAVIAYHHPIPDVASYAAELHFHIAEELFHFMPESRGTFLLRHRDKKDGVDPLHERWSAQIRVAHEWYMDGVMRRFKPQPESKPVDDVTTMLHALWTNNKDGVYDKPTWIKFQVAVSALRAKSLFLDRDAEILSRLSGLSVGEAQAGIDSAKKSFGWKQTEPGGPVEPFPLSPNPQVTES